MNTTNSKIVLIIEDDQDLLEIMEQNFSKLGFKVITASALPNARTKLVNQKFDLVLMDYCLEHGHTVDKLLSEFVNTGTGDPLNVATPLIICSGTLDPKAIAAFGKRTKHFLVKPISFSEIANIIKDLKLL